MTKSLYLWNLSPETTREDLYSLFGQLAQVISIEIPILLNDDDRSIGLGFVKIETGNLPRVIEKVRVIELDGRTVQVSESLPSHIATQRVGKVGLRHRERF